MTFSLNFCAPRAGVTVNDLDFTFRIRLYELPHPEDETESEKSA